MRLVAEIESRRRVRGAESPWTRMSLGVRVRWSGTPGMKLPASLRDRRLTVRRETTAPETYRRGDVLHLTAEEAASLGGVDATVTLRTPELRVTADASLGAVVTDLRLAGDDAGTVAFGPLRLGVGEEQRATSGGAQWEVGGRGDLWKARFRRARGPAGTLRLEERRKPDRARVIRTLEPVPGTTLLVDRLEVLPGKSKAKGKRPEPAGASIDLALDVGDGTRVLFPEHDRLATWRHIPDPARAWLMWAGTSDRRAAPPGGFAAAVGSRAVHVLLMPVRDVELRIADSRRDHPALRLKLERRRPPATREVVHLPGRRACFSDGGAVAVVAETVDEETGVRTAHVTAYRRGSRARTGRAVVVVGGRERTVILERHELGAVGAVHAGRVALERGAPVGDVEVRLGRERIVVEPAP